MDIRKIDDTISVSPQIGLENTNELAALGFKSIICDRPDAEEADQSTGADVCQAPMGAGLDFRHIPVIGSNITDNDIALFREALAVLPKPILAYCRSGTRSATLWALSTAETTSVEHVMATAAEAGYDLNALRSRLEGLNGEPQNVSQPRATYSWSVEAPPALQRLRAC